MEYKVKNIVLDLSEEEKEEKMQKIIKTLLKISEKPAEVPETIAD